jgi:2-oxoisovalerate dehydrogenase E2 component (dihydrolipoyl transacylase)
VVSQRFALPDVGEGLTEAEVVAWRVQVGDTVAVNDVLIEIETAKSVVELPSPYAGVVTALLVEEGQTIEVGTELVAIGDGSEEPAEESQPAAARDVAAPAPAAEDGAAPGPDSQQTLVGSGPRGARATRRPRKTAAATLAVAPPHPSVTSAVEEAAPGPTRTAGTQERSVAAAHEPAGASSTTRALAKPSVRKLAKDLGITLTDVTPTGPDGTVSQDDVTAFAAAAAASSNGEGTGVSRGWSGFLAERGETRIDVKGIRRATAQAMVRSAFTAPHVTEWTEVDVTRLVELVDKMKGMRMFRDVRITPTVLVARAVCLALRRNPELNSTWDESASQIVRKGYVNLGIAADTPRGLLVPVIPDADALSTYDLAKALSELTATARAGKTQPAQQTGGTFTITNIGVFGIDGGTPILNPGEAGILALGNIAKKPWVVDDRIEPRWVTTLALSFDHRMVDGAEGSAFLADMAAILNDPGATLILA